MLTKINPIIETLTRDAVESALSLRYDICTCPVCRKDILAEALRAVHPARDVIEGDTIDAVTRQVKTGYMGEINHAVLNATEKIGNHPSHPQEEDRKKIFKSLLQKILADRGLDFRNYHIELLKRRFAIRIKANNLYSYTGYMKLLDSNPREYDRLFETLCINVSEFFRDPPMWVTLQYLLDHMVSEKIKKADRNLTIWSAGCANGEEAFSLAIAASEALKFHTKLVNGSIIATDIDKRCVARAKKAQYASDSIKNVNDKLLAKYFITEREDAGGGDDKHKTYRVREAVTQMVSFSELDLITGEYPRNIDLLVCRNVFIYFNRQLQEKILRKFFDAIRPGGYLCMGQAESMIMEVRKFFEDTDSNARIYRRP
ncbi:MAG: protein-glutamate O-methyltransferase CheR [Candidatus Omnitrophota bacterium]